MAALKTVMVTEFGVLLARFLPGPVEHSDEQRARLMQEFEARGFLVLGETANPEDVMSASKPNDSQLYFLKTLEASRRSGSPWVSVGDDVPFHVRQFCVKQGWVDAEGKSHKRRYRITMEGAKVLIASAPDYQGEPVPAIAAEQPAESPVRAAIRPYSDNGQTEQPDAWDYHNGPQPAPVAHLIAALEAEPHEPQPAPSSAPDELTRLRRERDAYYALLVQMNNLTAHLFLLLLSAKMPDAAPLVETFTRLSQQVDAVEGGR